MREVSEEWGRDKESGRRGGEGKGVSSKD